MEWINQAVAFTIIGLVIWGVNKLTSKFKGTGSSDSVAVASKARPSPEQKSVQVPRSDVATFLKRYGWLLGGAVLLFVIAVIGWNYYSGEQEKRWQCLQRIEYIPTRSFYRLDDEKQFNTQDEAIRYCLSELSHGVGFRPL